MRDRSTNDQGDTVVAVITQTFVERGALPPPTVSLASVATIHIATTEPRNCRKKANENACDKSSRHLVCPMTSVSLRLLKRAGLHKHHYRKSAPKRAKVTLQEFHHEPNLWKLCKSHLVQRQPMSPLRCKRTLLTAKQSTSHEHGHRAAVWLQPKRLW